MGINLVSPKSSVVFANFHWCSLLRKFVSSKFVTWKEGLLRYENLFGLNRSFRLKITVKFIKWCFKRFLKQAFIHICIHACVKFLTMSTLLDRIYTLLLDPTDKSVEIDEAHPSIC